MQAEDLGYPVVQPLVVAVEGGEAADVDRGQVQAGLALGDPLGQRPPGAAGRGDADRVEAGADEEVPQLRGLAQDELVVRGEALRAVVEHLDPGLGQDRDPVDRAVHQDREVVPVLLEQLELERVGQRVGRDPRLGVGLEAADDQPADLLLDVGIAVRVAQDREVPVHPVDLLGDHVEVFGRMQRHGHAAHRADRLGPLAGAVDHHLGLDLALVGADAGDLAVVREDAGDPGSLADGDALVAGAAGQRGGQVGRVGPAVAGQPDRPFEVVVAQDRVELFRLLRADQLALELVGLGGGRGPPQLGHPVLGASDGDAAAAPEAGAQAGLCLEPLVQLAGVLHQPGAVLRGPQLADQAGRVPGGAAGQLPLLEQQHVGPAQLGQVVGDAGADHAAPDDDDAGPGGEGWAGDGAGQVPGVSHRAGSVISLDVLEELGEVAGGEAAGRALEALHGPGPEVVVDRARAVLDRAPQRPPVHADQAAEQPGPGDLAPPRPAVVCRDQVLQGLR